ncbi:MAG: GntR family transcriptional regulator [Acidobacteriota bacterium]
MKTKAAWSAQLSTVQVQSISGAVALKLRDAILTGELKPGERLVEQKVAKLFGIGQPTLREALKELEYQGFVRKSPKRGTYVTQLSQEDIRKMFEVRMALESLAVYQAAQNLTDAAVRDLEELLRSMELAAQRMDLPAYHRIDLAFHTRIWNLSGNEYLRAALERIAFGLFAFLMLKDKDSPNSYVSALEQHRTILRGLRSGSPQSARTIFVETTCRHWKELRYLDVADSFFETISSNLPAE